MRYVLGADIGTTRTKCLLFDERGAFVAAAYRDYPCVHEGVDRSEQDARDWWRAFVESAREVLSRVDGEKDVRAICMATQGGTLVAVDRNGEPLAPAAVWNDSRCADERALFAEKVAPETVWRRTGWSLGNALNALEILWLREHRRDVFDGAWKFLSVPSYMSYKLTGDCAVDLSNAGIEQLCDIDRKIWDDELCEAAGITPDRLSRLAPSGEVIGHLTKAAAEELGVSEKTLLVSGAHDQYLCALGAGAMDEGDAFIATGTCWVVARVLRERPTRHCVSRSAVNGLWGALESHESGGGALEWIRRATSQEAPLSYDALNREAGSVAPGADGLMFYPFLTGASSPVRRDDVKAAFIGLTAKHGRPELFRAVMEGVCLQVAWMLEDFSPTRPEAVAMTGGATNSAVWTQIMADVLNRPVRVPLIADAGCVGAAMLAGATAGVYPSLDEAARLLRKGERVVEPGAAANAYARLFDRYKRNCRLLEKMYDGNEG